MHPALHLQILQRRGRRRRRAKPRWGARTEDLRSHRTATARAHRRATRATHRSARARRGRQRPANHGTPAGHARRTHPLRAAQTNHPSPSSASSKRPWGSAGSACAGSPKCAPNGRWSRWPTTSRDSSTSARGSRRPESGGDPDSRPAIAPPLPAGPCLTTLKTLPPPATASLTPNFNLLPRLR